MHQVPILLVNEVLSVRINHLRYLSQRDTPEWLALHRRLVQRLRGQGIETLINPLSEDAEVDERISRGLFRGDVQMRRIMHVGRAGNVIQALRGTKFQMGDDLLLLGSHMTRPVILDENKLKAMPPDNVAIFLAATTLAAAETIGLALARMLI